MTRREVKLIINVEGIVQKCRDINSMEDMKEVVKYDDKLSHLAILKCILKDNLKIENSPYSDEENQHILSILENDIYYYFLYHGFEASRVMFELRDELENKYDDLIRTRAISLVNELINSNKFIYNPDHGMNRKNEGVKFIKINDGTDKNNLGTRTYTLEIDDAKLPDLKRIADFTEETLNRDNLRIASYYVRFKNILLLKDFVSIQDCYTLEDLYTKKDEKTNMSLVDYGLDLIHKKYFEIRDLVEKAKEANDDEAQKQSIINQLNGLFPSEGDMRVFLSIIENSPKILNEKEVQKCMIKALDYMATNTDILGKVGEQKVLKIKSDLSNFNRDYMSIYEGLKRKVQDAIIKLEHEKEALKEEKEKYTGTDSTSQNESRTLSVIENAIKSLKWRIYKGNIQSNNVDFLTMDLLRPLRDLNPVQKQYIIKKIKESADLLNVQVVVTD
ncbi:hypothetical protein NEMIN01_2413, partial [Nematocida minor]|uniref:uncharacterized protein n=1 Tax=Nematocida minor TaxID=1912983 RepID=UPI00222056D4